MITATKEFKWSMAHMLAGHKGLCQNLHGHNYKMEITAALDLEDDDNKALDVFPSGCSEGMVLDFKFLKHVINDVLIDKLDHATMIWEKTTDDFEIKLTCLLREYKKKIYVVPYRPTAENMAKSFLLILQNEPCIRAMRAKIIKVRIYETDSSYAEATEED